MKNDDAAAGDRQRQEAPRRRPEGAQGQRRDDAQEQAASPSPRALHSAREEIAAAVVRTIAKQVKQGHPRARGHHRGDHRAEPRHRGHPGSRPADPHERRGAPVELPAWQVAYTRSTSPTRSGPTSARPSSSRRCAVPGARSALPDGWWTVAGSGPPACCELGSRDRRGRDSAPPLADPGSAPGCSPA